jgi:tyrosinase
MYDYRNVDRLFAIWQAIWPDSYTTSEVNEYGTYTIAPGATDDINSRTFSPILSFDAHTRSLTTPTTALTPLHSDSEGTLYTSATVRSTRTFGYSYPEVVDWGVNFTQLSSNVRANVNKLYNPTGRIAARSLRPRFSNTTHEYNNATNATTDYQYFVNIQLDK